MRIFKLILVYKYAILYSVTEQKVQKLNQLQHLLPEGLLVDASWMNAKGYSRALLSQYVASGWLEHPAWGVYRRPSGKLQWQHVVISMQSLLDIPVVVGGRTALELQGYAHYLSPSGIREVHFYGDRPLPTWVNKLEVEPIFWFHNAKKLFRSEPIPRSFGDLNPMPNLQSGGSDEVSYSGFVRQHWGHWNWPLIQSAPERAILELLDQVPQRETFHQADMLIEGLRTLSPRRLQKLLENCLNVKVKRLFLWFADRHKLPWFSQIDQERVNLGTGKRMLVPGGKLDEKYQITVPKDLHGIR